MDILPVRNKLSKFFYDSELCDIHLSHFSDEIKSNFPDGIWQHEPDEIIWYNRKYHQVMAIERDPNTGALRGYVGINHNQKEFEPFWKEFIDLDIYSRDVYFDNNAFFPFKNGDYEVDTYLCIDCNLGRDYYTGTYDFRPGKDGLTLLKSGIYEYRDIDYLAYMLKKLSFEIHATLEVLKFNLTK